MTAVTILLDGLAFGMILFIISVGLTVTMGLMRIVNLAHGAFAMTGGYVGVYEVAHGVPYLWAALGAAAFTAVMGGILEPLVFRPLYRRPHLSQALMTFGLTFVIIASLTSAFGTNNMPLPLPEWLNGQTSLGYRNYPTYRLFLILVGALIAGVMWLVVERSDFGARLRAAVDNPRMARAVGIDVNKLFLVTFAGACGLAGLGGVLGSGLLSIEPSYGLRYLILFLVVVGVGGSGSFKGSFGAAILLGLVDTVAVYLVPPAADYIFYAFVVLLLLYRPHGLIPAPSAG